MRLLVTTIGIGAITILSARVPATIAAESPPSSTYTDKNCGIEFKYPAPYQLNPSGAKDFCALSLLIGLKEARQTRWLFSLNVTELDRAHRQAMAESRSQVSPSSFAVHLAALQCQADGPEGSTYCTDGKVRSTFKTAKGLEAHEIYLTEVHESFAQKKIEKRPKGPIFALDMSNDETVWILLAEGSQDHLATLRAILDTLNVWGKARRQTPRVVEVSPFPPTGQLFNIRVIPTRLSGARSGPPRPPTSLFLLDPQGRRLGTDPATNAPYSEIPAITYSGWGESGVGLRELVEGRYELEITGTIASIPYQIVVQAPDRTGKPSTAARAGRTSEPGTIDRYELVYSRSSAPALTLAEAKDFSDITVLLSGSGVVASELLLTDPQGRRTGLDPLKKVEYRKIPRSSYLDEGTGRQTMLLHVRQPMDGSYILQATGTATGSYSLDIRVRDRGGKITARPEFRNVPTDRDAVHLYLLESKTTPNSAFKVAGGFDGGGQKTPEANRLLTYANPTGPHIRLPARVSSFPLLIFYGAAIQPTTFSAMLNGSNISGRFTPVPDQSELVWVPLKPGSNMFALTAESVSAGGQRVKDTDELMFLVE